MCAHAVAAAEKVLVASRDIVGYSDLTLLVPHAVARILADQKVDHLSAQRWLIYHTAHITVQRCTTLNPATLLPTEEEGEPHCCIDTLELTCLPQIDLLEEPLSNADINL